MLSDLVIMLLIEKNSSHVAIDISVGVWVCDYIDILKMTSCSHLKLFFFMKS